jgi:REP element-mobilizing transposase RayT
VRPLPGRPPSKTAGVSHHPRPELGARSALHVTLKATRAVPNLRSRKRYGAIKAAFVRFCAQNELCFRLVHFAVLSNHLHFVVEADSKRALSLGMQKLLHSISGRLNALSVREHGARQSTTGGSYRALQGWLGRVFADRYHAHPLKTPTEMERAVRYVRDNAEHHYHHGGPQDAPSCDPFSSFADNEEMLTAAPRGFLLRRACDRQRIRR